MSAAVDASATAEWRTPSLVRRMSCFLYEGVLLFGVVWAAGMVYSIAMGQRHAMTGQTGMQVVQFL
ncbi:MAG: RDD family protein, partial [Piscinibacter sp.]